MIPSRGRAQIGVVHPRNDTPRGDFDRLGRNHRSVPHRSGAHSRHSLRPRHRKIAHAEARRSHPSGWHSRRQARGQRMTCCGAAFGAALAAAFGAAFGAACAAVGAMAPAIGTHIPVADGMVPAGHDWATCMRLSRIASSDWVVEASDELVRPATVHWARATVVQMPAHMAKARQPAAMCAICLRAWVARGSVLPIWAPVDWAATWRSKPCGFRWCAIR